MSTTQSLLTVSEAVSSRRSIRDFLDKEVPYDLIMKILNEARYAPSSSNLQPWKIYLLHGDNKQKLSKIMQSKLDTGVMMDLPIQFQMYPGVRFPAHTFLNEMKKKFPVYYNRYSTMGRKRYEAVGIKRGDLKGRIKEVFRCYDFLGAPVGLILTINKCMSYGNYPDLGIMLQTIMLLSQQYGLSTCSIGAWQLQHETLRKALNIPHDEVIFCGMAIGYQNKDAAVNKFKRDRVSIDDMVIIPKVVDIDEMEKKFESIWWFKLKMAMILGKEYAKKYWIAIIFVVIALVCFYYICVYGIL